MMSLFLSSILQRQQLLPKFGGMRQVKIKHPGSFGEEGTKAVDGGLECFLCLGGECFFGWLVVGCFFWGGGFWGFGGGWFGGGGGGRGWWSCGG